MSSDIATINDRQPATGLGKQTQWMRVRYAGMTSGQPPRATVHATLTLRNGNARHVSQAVRVTDESLQLRLLQLPDGAEVRVCTETDWDAPDIPVTLIDFCCVAPELPDAMQQTT